MKYGSVLSLITVMWFSIQLKAGVSTCAQVLNETSFVSISSIDGPAQASKLTITSQPLQPDKTDALAQLMSLASHTRMPNISDKEIAEKGQFLLDVPLKDGYSAQLLYVSDFRDAPTYTLKGADLVSPSNRVERLSKKLLNFHELKIRDEATFDLSDLFPLNFDIRLEIPVAIEGPALNQFLGLLPKFKYFTKYELQEYARDKDMRELVIASHFRNLKNWIITRATRLGASVILTSITVYGTNVMMKPTEKVQALNEPQKIAWVLDSNLELGLNQGKDLQSEVQNLNKDILAQSAIHPTTAQILKFSSQNLKINDSTYAWSFKDVSLANSKTYIVFSKDDNNGTISYFITPVDAQKYPKLLNILSKPK